jgi:hypothetical protein
VVFHLFITPRNAALERTKNWKKKRAVFDSKKHSILFFW